MSSPAGRYWPSLRELTQAVRADRALQAAVAGRDFAVELSPYLLFCGAATRLDPLDDEGLHVIEHRTPCLRLDGRYYCSPECLLALLGGAR